jgi:hypothetical protein
MNNEKYMTMLAFDVLEQTTSFVTTSLLYHYINHYHIRQSVTAVCWCYNDYDSEEVGAVGVDGLGIVAIICNLYLTKFAVNACSARSVFTAQSYGSEYASCLIDPLASQ